MNKRRIGLAAVAAIVCAITGTLAVRHFESPDLVRAGSAVVVIEGRHIDLSPWNDSSIGVGVGGKLGLVGGRCVGFVYHHSAHLPRQDVTGRVIVWPPGTRVAGTGEGLRITSEGKTVRLGELIGAGSEFGHDVSGIKQRLPRACREVPLVQVGLNS